MLTPIGSLRLPSTGPVVPPQNLGPLVFVIVAQAVLFGLPLGVAAFSNALVDNGIFRDSCAAGDHTNPCENQKTLLTQTIQLVDNAGMVAAWPVGYLTEIYGPRGLGVAAIAAAAVGYSMCGIDLHSGWCFVVGMVVVSFAGSAFRSIAMGGMIGAATGDDEERFEFWTDLASACTDVGVFLAFPVGVLITWHLLPLWGWFVFLGVAILVAFVPSHIVALRTIEDSRTLQRPSKTPGDADEGTALVAADRLQRPAAPNAETGGQREVIHVRSKDILSQRVTWLIIFRHTTCLALLTAILGASYKIIPMFGLSPRVTLYIPVAVGIASVCLIVFIALGLAKDASRMFVIRMLLQTGLCVLYAVPALRKPATYWAGVLIAGLWVGCNFVVVLKNATMLGRGGSEAKTTGIVLTLAGILTFPFGQAGTYVLGHSSAGLTWGMVAFGIVSVVADCCILWVERQLRRAGAGETGDDVTST